MPKEGPNDPQMSLELTQEQQAQIQEFFGHQVSSLTLSIGEYNASNNAGKLKVLRVDNVALIQGAGVVGVSN